MLGGQDGAVDYCLAEGEKGEREQMNVHTSQRRKGSGAGIHVHPGEHGCLRLVVINLTFYKAWRIRDHGWWPAAHNPSRKKSLPGNLPEEVNRQGSQAYPTKLAVTGHVVLSM